MSQIVKYRRKNFENTPKTAIKPFSYVSHYIPVKSQSYPYATSSIGSLSTLNDDSIFDLPSPTNSEIEVPIFEGVNKRRSQYLSFCQESMNSRCNSVADNLEFSNVKDKMKIFDCDPNPNPFTFKCHYIPPKKYYGRKK